MNDHHCPNCGAKMDPFAECPECEHREDYQDGRRVECRCEHCLDNRPNPGTNQ